MSEGSESIDDRLDAWLDRELSEEEQSAFDRALERDPDLRRAFDLQARIDESLARVFGGSREADARRAVELQARIDESLARMFGGGRDAASAAARNGEMRDAAGIPAAAGDERGADRGRWRIVRPLALAAAIAILVIGAWLAVQLLSGPGGGRYESGPWRTFELAYANLIETGFAPQWVSNTDEEFEATFRKRFGQAIAMDPLPDGVEYVGHAVCNTLTPGTTCILAETSDGPIVVFIDRLERDSELPQAVEGDLHLHRATVGKLVLYELSPFTEPAVLPAIRRADEPGRGS